MVSAMPQDIGNRVKSQHEKAVVQRGAVVGKIAQVAPSTTTDLTKIEQLKYTKEYAQVLLGRAQLVREKEAEVVYVTKLLSLERQLDKIENRAIKNVLIESLIHRVKEQSETMPLPLIHVCQRTIDVMAREVIPQATKMTTAFQVRGLLSGASLPENIDMIWKMRWYLEELKIQEAKLPELIQTRDDIVLYTRWLNELTCVGKEIEKYPELSHLKPIVTELNKRAKVRKEILTSLKGVLYSSYESVRCHTYIAESDSEDIVHYPSPHHPDMNEDVLVHIDPVTVIVDGKKQDVYSAGVANTVADKIAFIIQEHIQEYDKPINPEKVFKDLIQKIAFVDISTREETNGLRSRVTMALEIRVPATKEGEHHRFIVIVGACDALWIRPGKKPVRLNWDDGESVGDQQSKGISEAHWYRLHKRVPYRTIQEIEKKEIVKEEMDQDTEDVKDNLSTDSEQSIFQGRVTMVYIAPEEKGRTVLLSSGLSERCRGGDISPRELIQIITSENMRQRYLESGQYQRDIVRITKVLEDLLHLRHLNSRHYNPTEDVVLKDFKAKFPKWTDTEDGIQVAQSDVKKLVRALKWPDAGTVVAKIQEFFSGCEYKDCGDVKRMAHAIALEQFRGNEREGDITEPLEDITYVDTDSCIREESLSALKGSSARRSLIVILEHLEHHGYVIDTLGGNVEYAFREIMREYHRGVKLIEKGEKNGDPKEIREFIGRRVHEALISERKRKNARSKVRTFVIEGIKGKNGLDMQVFLKQIGFSLEGERVETQTTP